MKIRLDDTGRYKYAQTMRSGRAGRIVTVPVGRPQAVVSAAQPAANHSARGLLGGATGNEVSALVRA